MLYVATIVNWTKQEQPLIRRLPNKMLNGVWWLMVGDGIRIMESVLLRIERHDFQTPN